MIMMMTMEMIQHLWQVKKQVDMCKVWPCFKNLGMSPIAKQSLSPFKLTKKNEVWPRLFAPACLELRSVPVLYITQGFIFFKR